MAVPDQSPISGEGDRSTLGTNPAFDSLDDDVAAYPEPSSFEGGPTSGSLGFGDTTGSDDGSSTSDQAKRAASAAGDRAADVAGTAKEEAAAVKDTAVEAGSDLADSVAKQAGDVASEVGQQSRRLMDEGMSELRSQASAGQQRLAELSRSFGGELQAMHSKSDQSGPLTDLVGSAQHMFDDAANWLERNEPSDVLDSVRRYASRSPWAFLAISAGVGFLGARVVRGLKKPDNDDQPRAALDVPAGYHGGYTAEIPPLEDPSYGGGPRYGADTRVQPSATPGTGYPDAGWDTTSTMPPVGEPGYDTRGL